MVTTGLSMALALVFKAGPADVPVAEVVDFAALAFPLMRCFLLFPFTVAPLFFPPGTALRTWGLPLLLYLSQQ